MKLISLKEHLELMEKNKSIALMDMDTFFEEETRMDENQPRSIMTAHLKYRNPGDEEKLLIDQFHLSPSVKLNQDLLEEMEVYSNRLFRLYDNYAEPLENMVYWEVIKWIYINKSYSLHYRAYFSLRMELLSVEADTLTFDILNNIGCLNRLTERQISMNENTKQIFCDNAHGVILPYKPGDILYIDGNPFERPFYAVYCSEFVINEDGEKKRYHGCLYNEYELRLTDLTGFGYFRDFEFPYPPLDRIKVVEDCNDLLLKKASKLLKEDSTCCEGWRTGKIIEM